jgi:hypothetical protein
MTTVSGPSTPGAPAPTVSVIIPCFNYGHFLQDCLGSVLGQEGADVKILVIDDRSTDGSAEVAARLCARDERIEFRPHRQNAGLIATANEGLAWADGDYVILLSADDMLVPGSLARATSIMSRHPNVGLVYGRPLLAMEGRPLPLPSGRWRRTYIWRGEDWIRMRCRTAHNAMSSPEVVVRNSVQQAVGGYDPSCPHTSDLNLWLRIAAVADIAHVRGVPQAIYRVLSGSMTRAQESPLVDLIDRRSAFDSFLSASAPRLRDPVALSSRARRALARQALWQASRTVDRGIPGELERVEQFVDFALDTYPDVKRLREWYGLAVRRRIGPGRSRAFPPFVATGAAHRLRYHAGRVRWRLRGV